MSLSMKPQRLIETILEVTNRTCPECDREDALTTKDARSIGGNFVIGDVWCPACGFEETVTVDGDAQRRWFRYGNPGQYQ